MKLTKEQVEIERDKYEKVLLDSNEYSKQNLIRVNEKYCDWKVQSGFEGWIMSRESNNEIELNMKDIPPVCRPRLFEKIESQGYTITDGGTK